MEANASNKESIPPAAMTGVDYLIEFLKPTSQDPFNPAEVAGLIEFVTAARPDGIICRLPKRIEATSAYYEFKIQKSLKEVLQLAYHPEIPRQIVTPGLTRCNQWRHIDSDNGSLPNFWEHLDDLTQPIVVKGVEIEEITPDLFSGAYYRSPLDRALILFSNSGHPVFLSVTRQKEVSEVGKKGLVLGADDQWNFFYSGKKGLSKSGLGWVDSFIYDTFSVLVFTEVDQKTPITKCGIFKWLRAGWLGMNVVKESHMQAGFERFARDMKRVIESPRLPAVGKIVDMSHKINGLPNDTLKTKMGQYLQQLEKRLVESENRPHRWIKQAAHNNEYVSKLSASQMQAALFLEALKYQLGLLNQNDIDYLGVPMP